MKLSVFRSIDKPNFAERGKKNVDGLFASPHFDNIPTPDLHLLS